MDSKLASLLIMYTAYTVAEMVKNKKNKTPCVRVNPYLIDRKSKGRFNKDFQDLKKHPQAFKENFHIDVNTFTDIFEKVRPHLMPKCNSRPSDNISPEEKFAVVIEYFASGSLQRHMASIYRISKQHLGTIIDQVCLAICVAFHNMVPPMTRDNLLSSANEFNAKWQFPHCLGAIDGKHVALKAPRRAGTLFYNYKGFHSLVLLAVADATYRFTYVNVGAFGSESDANIFATSQFGRKIIQDRLEFPPDANIAGCTSPFFFVADDAFPLCKRIMKPYGGRKHLSNEEIIFNYRLSRARRCIENAFGILTARGGCLKRTMLCSPDRAKKIVTACCFLHNYLIGEHKHIYCPTNFADKVDAAGRIIDGEWRRQVANSSLYGNFLRPHRGRQLDIAKNIRNNLKNFVNSPLGAVPWQRECAFLK